MDARSPLLDNLISLVGDLAPGPETTEAELDHVRQVAAEALVAGLATPSTSPGLPDLGHDAVVLQSALDAAARRRARPATLANRRTLPVFSTQAPGSLPSWANGRAIQRTVGPFRDRLGRPVWIDLYRILPHVRLVRSAGATPFLTLPVSVLAHVPASPHPRYSIPAGSVWISSQLIAAAAPAGAYTGLRVSGGHVQFSQPVAIAGNEVIVPPGVNCSLELDLETEPPPAGHGDGGDARAAEVQTPKQVTVLIDGSTATFTKVGRSRLEAYGTEVKLSHVAGAPEYLPTLNRIAVPLHANLARFAVKSVASRLFQPAGDAAITRSGWGLPVAVADPATLGDASGSGALLLWLAEGLRATWLQASIDGRAALGPSILAVDPARLALFSTAASPELAQQRIPLWEAEAPNVAILRWRRAFPLQFFSQATGSEALAMGVSFDATVDRPIEVNGQRLALHADPAAAIFIASQQGLFLLVGGALSQPPGGKRVGLGIANSVFICQPPTRYVGYLHLDAPGGTVGVLALAFTQQALVPTLPDPYANNLDSLRALLDQGTSPLVTLTSWKPGESARLDFLLPSEAGSLLASAESPHTTSESTSRRAISAIDNSFARGLGDALAFERQHGVILVDLSTRSDQFGVAVVRNREPPSFAVKDLYLEARGQDVVLLTLPAVQWEAVITESDPNDPGFPHRLGFANSGVPSLLYTPTVRLVPVHPSAMLDGLVEDFAGASPTTTSARFTLPFGMIASATLAKPDGKVTQGATVSYNRPKADDLEGAHQLTLRAVDTTLPEDQSPAFPGFTIQLPNGEPGGRSVLGSAVTTLFNSYVGAGGFRPMVPVTRLDLCGYGESLFSDWRNPYTDPVAVSQARFDVFVGRTALEIVQVRSYLYPYAVQVVRTITNERTNGAVIMRRDSGWQAVSDGTYAFPGPPVVETHPGVVRRATAVSHLRDTGQVLTIDGIALAAVRFDCDLELDGADGLAPARDQLGFVQLTAGNLMQPSTYEKLLAAAGPLGGPIDMNIHIGGGHQQMRLTRVGVGATRGTGGPEFAMAAWGGPRFPGGGQWSFLRLPAPNAAPIAIPPDGVPLIRAGVASAGPPSPTSPYRFADPVDLLQPDTPNVDYGILHATGTQRVFFPRPRLEATLPSRIVSTRIPLLADSYSLATSLGAFPETPKTIPFPSNDWALEADGAGNYRLALPASPFPVTVGRRTLRQAGTVRGDVDYTGAIVTYQVDTAQPVPWLYALDGASKVMNSSLLGDVIRLGANVRASAERATVFEQPSLELGGGLTVVQDLLTILADLGITGVMTATMTNDWSIKVALKVPFKDAMGKDLQIPPSPAPVPDIIFSDTEVSVEIDVWPDADETEFKLGGQPMFAIKSVPGLYAVAIIEFGIKLSTKTGTTYSLTLGVGIAYSLDAGPFGFKGMFGITIFGFIGDTTLGWGMGFILSLSAEIEPIVSIELKLEGKLAMVWACKGTDHETLYGAAKLTFAIEVSVFLVFSISFEYETTSSEVLRGSGAAACPLPDVIP